MAKTSLAPSPSSRARITFCTFPPERKRTGVLGEGVWIPKRRMSSEAFSSMALRESKPRRAKRA